MLTPTGDAGDEQYVRRGDVERLENVAGIVGVDDGDARTVVGGTAQPDEGR